MSRIDAILIALAVFLIGGLAYIIFQFVGMEAATAGIWSQVLLVVGLIGWVMTYLIRVFNNDMTYHKQVKDYEDAFFAKQLEKMSPEQIEQLMAEKD